MSTVFGDDGTARGGGRGDALGRWIGHHPIWALIIAVVVIFFVWLVLAPWPAGFEDVFGKKLIFINALFNGITLGGLYFLVATGFTLIFGLMRNVNLAHGSLYLFGGYMGYEAGDLTGSWLFGYVIAFISCAIVGMAMQFFIFRRMEGQDLRQTLVTLGLVDHLLRSDGLGLGWQRDPDRHPGLFGGAGSDSDHCRRQIERRERLSLLSARCGS